MTKGANCGKIPRVTGVEGEEYPVFAGEERERTVQAPPADGGKVAPEPQS